MKRYIFIILLIYLAACTDTQSPKHARMENKMINAAAYLPIDQLDSGIRMDGMRKFLNCWSEQTRKYAKRNQLNYRKIHGILSNHDSNMDLPLSWRLFNEEARKVEWASIYDIEHSIGRFHDGASVKSFKLAKKDDYEIWMNSWGGISFGSDSDYYRYDNTQGVPYTTMRVAYLNNAILLGEEENGAFYIMIKENKTRDGENEILFLHHGGLIVRFKSFAHLLANLYLEEYQLVHGLDPSEGNIYYFKVFDDTCIPFLFRDDEIKSWHK